MAAAATVVVVVVVEVAMMIESKNNAVGITQASTAVCHPLLSQLPMLPPPSSPPFLAPLCRQA